jgi:signal peptidase I
VLVVALAWLVWPAALGGSTSLVVVAGASMEPTYHTGDVLIVKRRAPSVGDVIVFTMPKRDGQIVHRVLERRDDGTMLVQGDNRSTPDLPLPTDADVVGVVRALIPQGWIVVKLLTSPLVLGVGAGSVVLARAVRRHQTPLDPPPTVPVSKLT